MSGFPTAALSAAMKASVGQPVTYTRGTTSVTLTAWASPPETGAVDDGSGALEAYESWDWHIEAGDLGAMGLPQEGDTVTDAAGRVYEVLPPPGRKAWRYSGSDKTLLRVHTKLTGEAQ
jgi:hypothetical protein